MSIAWLVACLLFSIASTGSPGTETAECTGGQLDGTCEATQSGHHGKCNVDVLHVSEMTQELFEDKYYLKRPVLVTDVQASPGPSKLWSTQQLNRAFGRVAVGTGSSRMLTKMGGTGRANVTIEDLLETLEKWHDHNKDVDLYAWDRDSPLFDVAPELLEAIEDTAHKVFGSRYAPDLTLKQKAKSERWSYYLGLGGKGSGVHLHHHPDGWSYLFEGRKRWFLKEPLALPAVAHWHFLQMRYWLEKGVYPKLQEQEQLLECEQLPGELLYVPEGWWHGTLNEGTPVTLSVAAQRQQPVTDLEKWLLKASSLKMDGKRKEAAKIFRKIVKKYPTAAEAWYILGIIYGANRPDSLEDELQAKQRASDLAGGRNCDTLVNLGTALVHWQQYEKAEETLREAADLCEWDHWSWLNLAAALEPQGRAEEAQAAFDKAKEMEKEWNSPRVIRVGQQEIMT